MKVISNIQAEYFKKFGMNVTNGKTTYKDVSKWLRKEFKQLVIICTKPNGIDEDGFTTMELCIRDTKAKGYINIISRLDVVNFKTENECLIKLIDDIVTNDLLSLYLFNNIQTN